MSRWTGGAFSNGTSNMVAHQPGGPAAAEDQAGERAGRRQHLLGDRPALGRVAVEQGSPARPRNDHRELPGEILGIPDARVHALAAEGAVDVRGVPGQQHAPATVARCEPRWIPKVDVQSQARNAGGGAGGRRRRCRARRARRPGRRCPRRAPGSSAARGRRRAAGTPPADRRHAAIRPRCRAADRGRRARRREEVLGERDTGKPMSAAARTRLCAPSQPITQSARSVSPSPSMTSTPPSSTRRSVAVRPHSTAPRASRAGREVSLDLGLRDEQRRAAERAALAARRQAGRARGPPTLHDDLVGAQTPLRQIAERAKPPEHLDAARLQPERPRRSRAVTAGRASTRTETPPPAARTRAASPVGPAPTITTRASP